MDINTAFPSSFLKAADLQGRCVDVTIENVTIEKLGEDSKPVVHFMGKEMGLALNKINSNAIAMMYSSETNNWTGQVISIYPTETEFAGKIVPCIRVKAPGGQDVTAFIAQRTAEAQQTQQVTQANDIPPNDGLDGDFVPF